MILTREQAIAFGWCQVGMDAYDSFSPEGDIEYGEALARLARRNAPGLATILVERAGSDGSVTRFGPGDAVPSMHLFVPGDLRVSGTLKINGSLIAGGDVFVDGDVVLGGNGNVRMLTASGRVRCVRGTITERGK
jgi:hypothetical protein